MLNGVDLSRVKEGDVIDIPPREAGMLLISEWAVPLEQDEDVSRLESQKAESGHVISLAAAADLPRRKRLA
jgi:hypothetical protein